MFSKNAPTNLLPKYPKLFYLKENNSQLQYVRLISKWLLHQNNASILKLSSRIGFYILMMPEHENFDRVLYVH
jgi:hypothetical protein